MHYTTANLNGFEGLSVLCDGEVIWARPKVSRPFAVMIAKRVAEANASMLGTSSLRSFLSEYPTAA